MVDKLILKALRKMESDYKKHSETVNKRKDPALTEAGNQYKRGYYEGAYIALDVAVSVTEAIMKKAGKKID